MTSIHTAVEFVYSTHAGDPNFADAIDGFVRELPDRTADLLAAVRLEDWNEVIRQAQLIRNAAALYGFAPLCMPAAELEAAIRDNRPETLVHQAVNDMVALSTRVRTGAPE